MHSQQTEIPQLLVGMSVYHNDNIHWLQASVESVLEQTFQNFVFVIYIDGTVAPDIEKYLYETAGKDKRVKVFVSDVCLGLSHRMREIVDWGSSDKFDYFLRMDADDINVETRFERQVNFMQKNQEVDILGSSLIEVNEDNEKVGYRTVSEHHHILYRALPRRCPINHPTVCIRYSALTTKGNYNPKLKNTQDYFLWIEMAKNGAVFANLREPLLRFRRVDGFYKRRGKEKSLNELKARFKAMRDLKLWSTFNIAYALAVFSLRMMPAHIVKLAYKFDRKYFHKRK